MTYAFCLGLVVGFVCGFYCMLHLAVQLDEERKRADGGR